MIDPVHETLTCSRGCGRAQNAYIEVKYGVRNQLDESEKRCYEVLYREKRAKHSQRPKYSNIHLRFILQMQSFP